MALIKIGGGQNGAMMIGAISMVFGVIGAYYAFYNFKLKRKIENVPTSKVRSMAMGLVEVKGKVVARETIESPYSKTPCVFYDYRIEERQEKTYRDSKGKSRKEVKWVTVHSSQDSRRFLLEDETGKALVDPKDAEVPEEKTSYSGDKRHIEKLVLPDSEVYVLASAAENPEVAMSETGAENIMLKKGEMEKDLLISSKSEKELISRYNMLFIASLIAALVLLFFAVTAFLFRCGDESFLIEC